MRRPNPFTEATLPGPLSPLALSIGAVVAAGAVVVGVFAGPGTVACVQRGDFGQCMSETFFGGAPVGVAETTQEAGETAIVVEAEESAQDTAPAGETAESVAAAVMPSFGLVRVEPDGSAVIAGTATPSGEVQILANEDVIGSEIADASGDWAFVTTTPLPSGGVELRVLDVTNDQYATTSVVVVVQDDRTSEPLVVASEPGQASAILQGVTAPATAVNPPAAVADVATVEEQPAPEVAVAETEPAIEVAAAQEQPAAEQPVTQDAVADELAVAVAETQEPVVPAEEPATSDVAVAAEETAPAQETLVVAEDSTPAAGEEQPVAAPSVSPETADVAQVQEAPVEALTDEVAAVAEEVAVAAQTAVAETTEAASAATQAIEERIETAVRTEPPAPQPAVTPIMPASIDAVEIDGDRNFFAGAGTDGLSVRLYVDNRAIGVAAVRGGRWLVEAINVLTRGTQRVRADLIDDQGNVVSRAEVDFLVDVPAGDAPVVAEATETQPEPVAGTAVAQAETPAVAPVAETPAAQPVEQPATAPVVEVAPAAVAQDTTVAQPVAPAETPAPAQPSVPTLVGVADGDRVVSGQVIIRRGDNLWTIARRVYGEGMRYTQIYDANNDQIRDPDLIYPGQIFALPETDVVIGDEG